MMERRPKGVFFLYNESVMRETVTDAIVLKTAPRREYDRAVTLYTERLGKVEAVAVGALRPASKFAPHLDLLNLATVRLVEKNRFTVTDALAKERFPGLRADRANHAPALAFASALRELAPPHEADPGVWDLAVRSFATAAFGVRPLLALFGYAPTHAACAVCGAPRPALFSLRDRAFLCAKCGSQFPPAEVVYIA